MHLAQRLLLPPCITSHLTTFNFFFYFCASSPSLLRSACRMVTSFWVLTTALISLSPANSMISHVWIINKKHYRVPAQMKILVRFDSFPALQNIHDSNDLCTRPDTKKKEKKKKKKYSHACISFFLYRWTALHKSLFPCWPKEQSSHHRMLQPWRVISTASFYLAMTYSFGHNCSWCWTGIMCCGFCLQVPNEVRGIVLTPINPDWVIICIPKRDTADPTWCDKKKLSGQCLALNWRNFAKAWAKCVMCWCHLVIYLQGVCIAGQ